VRAFATFFSARTAAAFASFSSCRSVFSCFAARFSVFFGAFVRLSAFSCCFAALSCLTVPATMVRIDALTSSSSSEAYQMSIVDIGANPAMASL